MSLQPADFLPNDGASGNQATGFCPLYPSAVRTSPSELATARRQRSITIAKPRFRVTPNMEQRDTFCVTVLFYDEVEKRLYAIASVYVSVKQAIRVRVIRENLCTAAVWYDNAANLRTVITCHC